MKLFATLSTAAMLFVQLSLSHTSGSEATSGVETTSNFLGIQGCAGNYTFSCFEPNWSTKWHLPHLVSYGWR